MLQKIKTDCLTKTMQMISHLLEPGKIKAANIGICGNE